MLDIVESDQSEIYPENGHVIFYGARKTNLLNGRKVPSAGLAPRGILSEEADSDTPIVPALDKPLVDIGARGTLELYLENISAAELTPALPEDDFPDGTQIFEIFKADNVRRVTPLTVRRIRME